MEVLFDYPTQAHFGRKVPKSKFYEKAKVTTKLKEKFTSQIEKIVWSYKLATETINLAATESVPEIEIFDIYLKKGVENKEVDRAILELIDKAIPLPIIYQIHREDEVKVVAAYKRPSESDANKWVVESYFESEWVNIDGTKHPLPVAVDLGGLYEQLLQRLMPQEVVTNRADESIGEQVEKIEQIHVAQREIDKLQTKMNREQQFNRKADLNRELKVLRQALEQIKQGNG